MSEEKESFRPRKTQLTIQIAGAAIFGALSLVVSALTTPLLPRVPGWGIAYFDPVSIIWVLCFLVFGPISGLLCCVIGTFGLMPFDSFAPIGPIMKLCATLSLIIIPILLLKLYKSEEGALNSPKLRDPKKYIVCGLIGIGLRIGVMMIFNVWLFMTMFAGGVNFVSLEFIGMPSVSGWSAIIIGVIIINAETSIWDLLIPYLVVYGAKLDKTFEIW